MLDAATKEFFKAEAASGGGAHGSSGSTLRAAAETRGLDSSEASKLVALLQELGLNKYARLFLRQEVDVDSLLQLSDRDLHDMGLSAIGARRKLTAAIHRHRLQRQAEADRKNPGASPVATVGGMAMGAEPNAPAHGAAGEAGGGASSSSSAVPMAGEFYRGRYKLNGKTYLGGSARVVLGEDTRTGQAVAVKVHLSHAYFTREVKLLKHLRSEYVVDLLDHIDEEAAPPAIILEGGAASLSELLSQGQLSPVERKLVLERLCLAVDFVHSKNLVLVDLKPQNVVIFGSLLGLKLIDLECARKVGEPIPFKLTPFYASPELATAAVETMRLGELPSLAYHPRVDDPVGGEEDAAAGDGSRWGPNLQRLALLSENPTLARAVAAASRAANRAGDGSKELNRDELRQLETPLKLPSGKPLRAQAPMDVWALGMVAYELFVNEPFFAGCSDDVALQVLQSQTPLDLPTSRIAEPQAEHLLSKILQKRAKDRVTVEQILRHAYLVGGLDTQQVGGSFAMLHESQQTFKGELDKLTGRVQRPGAPPASSGGPAASKSFSRGGAPGSSGGSSFQHSSAPIPAPAPTPAAAGRARFAGAPDPAKHPPNSVLGAALGRQS